MSWKCPNCGSKTLSVMVTVSADLTQSADNYETDPNGDHEWDGDSRMTCKDCNYCSASRQFDQGISEEQALARILRHLAKLGWAHYELDDGDGEWQYVKTRSAEQVAEVCAAVEVCTLRFINEGNKTGVMFLVWGNSPGELVDDHSESAGFGVAVDEALASIWPLYPDDSEIVEEVF